MRIFLSLASISLITLLSCERIKSPVLATVDEFEILLNDFYDMGKHTITWDGSHQSSGMYFVRLESGEFIQTRKVVLVK